MVYTNKDIPRSLEIIEKYIINGTMVGGKDRWFISENLSPHERGVNKKSLKLHTFFI